ncbi:hypothetical protein RND81_08G127900 [Saponaria officinalis]|uniref:Uncharacterized protein n=1 Tax=Saponaria officinalis TaxID=3572 RepID=A0AAW1J722_SAPOF
MRDSSFSSLNTGNMLNDGHFDLNSVQFCSDSLKQRLKQTMINQELVFARQVFELHQLYEIQIAMTEEIKHRDFDNSSPVNLNNRVKHPMSELRLNAGDYKQKPINLQLSADEFIRQSSHDLSGKQALGRSFPIVSRNSFRHTAAFDLNRSLTIGEDTGKRAVEHKSWMRKRTYWPPPDIIDLEDPNTIFSNDADFGLPSDLITPSSCLKDKNNLQSASENRTGPLSHGSTSSRPFNDVGLTRHRQTLCNTGFCQDFVATNKSAPRERIKLDLNIVLLEDLSCISCSPSGVAITKTVHSLCPGTSSVSPTSPRRSHFSSCAEIHEVGRNSIITAEGPLSRGDKSESNEGKIVYVDLESDSGEELCNSGDQKIESVGSTSIEMENVPKLCPSYNESQTVDICPEKAYSGSPDSNVHCSSSKEAELDGTEQKAAELLMQLSLPKLIYPKVSETKEDDVRQCSSKSYEALVLNTKECGPDDYCISSNAIVEDVSAKKDGRYKLKRGTRMKDFQKDILSSLSTLSRHEIREDLNIFEGIIKSREYKRTRAKIANEVDWCRPTRTKRSRISRR